MDTNEKLEALKNFYAEMGDKNHFELLGIDQTADDAAVRSAYFGLVKNMALTFSTTSRMKKARKPLTR